MTFEDLFSSAGPAALGFTFGRHESPPAFVLPSLATPNADGSCELIYNIDSPGLREVDEFRRLHRLASHANASDVLGCKAGHLLFVSAAGNPVRATITFRLSPTPWQAGQQDLSLLETIITRATKGNSDGQEN